MKIGFIGLGVMGSRIAIKLLQGGYDVTVYNRTVEKTVPLVAMGAEMAEDIASLSKDCDIICCCLSMPKDCERVFLDHVIPNANKGAICIDFSTVGMKTSQMIYQVARKKGISYLDAPVSGGPEGVEQGALTIMVGGDAESFEKVLPLFKQFGKTIEYLGKSGSGSVAKLINQYLVAVHTTASSEAMVAGVSFGLDAEQLYQLLRVSYGNSRMLERHMEQYVLERKFQPGGAVKYVHKDVKLANELFSQTGIKHKLGDHAEDVFFHAIAKGLGNEDMSAVIKPLEKQCEVEVKRQSS
ncbi:NAD(P)-dependent oxidoreductase [Robertmurraya massiliosenegalensis]|uniref:NAD(P)-dependent oxidoreductase n=1 Tax=Robertmurraya massiliosenegalensis TaxID=1287657 RepID=UPI0002E287F0|nr:NAD(P)-dependent oxidoreductase [Robertmurraya massiliosenegalensis]